MWWNKARLMTRSFSSASRKHAAAITRWSRRRARRRQHLLYFGRPDDYFFFSSRVASNFDRRDERLSLPGLCCVGRSVDGGATENQPRVSGGQRA